MVSQPLRYFHEDPHADAWLKSLDQTRRLATRQGWCFQHVQALLVAIDQYAKAATGNRCYFLDKPQSVGGSRRSTSEAASVPTRQRTTAPSGTDADR
jgi:hypothetical protein